MKRFAYSALAEGLLLLYARPRFPVVPGVLVGVFDNVLDGDDVEEYTSNLLGPPQVSALLPLHFMLHRAFPSGAGPPPFTTELPHPELVSNVVSKEWRGYVLTALARVLGSSNSESSCHASCLTCFVFHGRRATRNRYSIR